MIFPAVELKFSLIHRTDAQTDALVRMYRLDDGGLSPEGAQQYQRTWLRTETVTFDEPHVPNGRLVAVARVKLQAWARAAGYDLPDGRLVCALP